MNIKNIAWVQDRLGNAALDLQLDGRQAHFRSSQRSELLDRGIVEGISYLRSERSDPAHNLYVHGSYGPELSDTDLIRCTDDPGVYALFTEMCGALRTGTWVAGARPQPN